MKFNLTSVFKPKLFEILVNGSYNKKTLFSDIFAGINVGIIALPLAIAFGIASGVTPQQGIITAIVGGVLTSLLGGSKFLIGGPTGTLIVLVFGIIQEFGFSGLIVATVIAGFILLLMGIFKLGSIIKFIPYPIVIGFTSGIALVIFSTQIKDFLGLSIENVPIDFIPKWGVYFSNISTISIPEALLGLFSLLVIIVWPYFYKKIPGSLISIIVATIGAVIISKTMGIEFATIGSKFPELASGVSLPKPEIPHIDFAKIRLLFQPAITIAILCAIETLMSAMVADGVTGKKHDSNTELIGQGLTNIITPFFGGIPSTGALAKTMANINNGGKTPVSGVIHAVVLLLIFLFLMPYAIYIPLATLAAILMVVSYNMSEWRTFKYLLKGHKADVAVLLITFFLTIVVGLSVAIEVGVLLAVALFVTRVSETSSITIIEDKTIPGNESEELAYDADMLAIPKGVEIYEIDGPFFFGLASKLDEINTSTHHSVKVRIIRMRKVPFIDSTGMNNLRNLWKRSRKEHVQLILSGVSDTVYDSLQKSGFVNEIGREFIYPHIQMAMAKASEIAQKAALDEYNKHLQKKR